MGRDSAHPLRHLAITPIEPEMRRFRIGGGYRGRARALSIFGSAIAQEDTQCQFWRYFPDFLLNVGARSALPS